MSPAPVRQPAGAVNDASSEDPLDVRKTLNPRSTPRITTLTASAGWIVAALLLATYVAMLRTYAVDFPWADDFSQILAVPHYVAQARTVKEKAREILTLSVEHRIATLRIAALTQAHVLGGLDFRSLMFFGSGLLLVAGALVVSVFEQTLRPFAAAVAAALLCSAANYGATLWATAALQHLGGAAYGLAAFYCLSRPGLLWQSGALVLALASAFTSAGGLLVFPVAVLILSLERRWTSAIAWLLCGTALFAVYFTGYEPPPYQGSFDTYVHNPLALPRFFLIALGSMGLSVSAALILGLAVSLIWLWLFASARIKTVPRVVIAWMAFLVLSLAAIAWGRAGFGEAGALISRYRVYSEFAVLVTLAALASQVPSAVALRAMAIAVPLSLAWFLVAWRHSLPDMERFSTERRNELDYYVAEGHNLPAPIPPADFRDYMLKVLRERGFYNPTRARPPHNLVPDDRPLDTSRPPAIGVETPIVGERVALLRVYGPDSAVLWLKNEEHQYRGTLDAMPRATLALGPRTGYQWGLYALADIAPGTYRIGMSTDGAAAPMVAWSDQSITVK